MTRPLFISYRRVDAAHANPFWRELRNFYSEHCVFFDKDRHDGIPLAADFRAVIDAALETAECMLVLIGDGWVSEEQLKRLQRPDDVVQHEIGRALARRKAGEGVEILPVLCGTTKMPEANKLPSNLAALTRLNAECLSDTPQGQEEAFKAIRDFIDLHCPGLRARLCNDWLRPALANQDLAQSRLRQHIAVRDEKIRIIPRSAALQALDKWWQAWPQQHDAFVLQGEEGDGKSWAVADWLAKRLDEPGFPVPLVYVPTRKLAGFRLLDVLAEGLAWIHEDQPERHKALLPHQLNREAGGAPLYLLVVDALNERPSQEWREFFNDLRVLGIRQRIAVIVLCRSGYWSGLNIPDDGLCAPWTLAPYTEAELDTLLKLRGSSLRETESSYSTDLLELLHRPRYFDLAFRLKDEVGHGGLTLERLIYEDWRDRTRRKGQMPLDHEQFLALLLGLAETYEDRRFPLQALGQQAQDLGADVTELRHELTSGGIIDLAGGRLQIGETHLALALGLVLAQEVEDAPDAAHMAEVIAARLAGQGDLQVRICAMALFHALMTQGYPDAGRFALLRAWIEGRNLDEDDLQRIPAYLPLQPQVYLQLAEVLWGELDNRHAQDYFMAGLLQHREHPNVRPQLLPTFTRWLGFVHPCGYRAFWVDTDIPRPNGTPDVISRLGFNATPGPYRVLDDMSITIIDRSDPNLLRLSQVASGVISHVLGPRYGNALATGLAACAAMGGSGVDFNWLLRIAPAVLRQDLQQRADIWLRINTPLAKPAASRLLCALSSEEANQQMRELTEEFRPRSNSFSPLWEEDDLKNARNNCLGRSPEQIANYLQKIALKPAMQLPREYVEMIQKAGADLNLNEVSRVMGQTSEDLTLEQIEPALCAFSPSRYGDLIRRLAGTLSDRRGEACQALSSRLLEHIPVLNSEERSILRTVWQACAAQYQPDRPQLSNEEASELFLFPAVVFELDELEQMQCIEQRGMAQGTFFDHEPAFRPISPMGALETLKRLRNLPQDKRQEFLNLLDYLAKALPIPCPELRKWLMEHFQTFDSVPRGLCLRLFFHTQDQEAIDQIITAGWRVQPGDKRDLENRWGSLLLARFGQSLSLADLFERISPEYLGYAIVQRGEQPEEAVAYIQALDTIQRTIVTVTRSGGNSLDTLAPHTQIKVDHSALLPDDRLSTADRATQTLRMNNAAWGGSAGNSSVDDWERSNDPDRMTDESNQLARQIYALMKSERAAGNPWFASSFQHGALDRVVAVPARPWRAWIAPLIDNAPHAARLLAACRGFYEKLCAALLTQSPADGVALFKAISRHSNVRITEARLKLPILLLDAFAAPAASELDGLQTGLLGQLVDAAAHDLALFEYALLAQQGGRSEWLRGLIEHWLASDWEFNQARALALLGFSAHQEDAARLQQWMAGHGDCWLRDVATEAAKRAQRHDWARTWFQRFLVREDRVESWAAFRLFLRCADRRVWLWLHDSGLQDAARWKQEAFHFNLGTVMSACKEGEKGWQDRFINHKVKPDEYWPWMGKYLQTNQ
ncbi:MAG: TIR domain-containing protein [Rhodocyclaceae bacterium]